MADESRLHTFLVRCGSAIVAILAVVAAVSVVIVVAWKLDEHRHASHVNRNTVLFGMAIGGIRYDQLEPSLREASTKVESSNLTIHTPKSTHSISAHELGLRVDIPATTLAIRKQHTGIGAQRFSAWIRGLRSSNAAPVVYRFDDDAVNQFAQQLDHESRKEPTEPRLDVRDNELLMHAGHEGRGYTGVGLKRAISTQSQHLPLSIHLKPGAIPPVISQRDARAFLETATKLTSEPLPVRSQRTTAALASTTLRTLARSHVDGTKLRLTLDDNGLTPAIAQSLSQAGTQPTEASFTVENELPKALDGKPGNICCDAAATPIVQQQFRDRVDGKPTPESPPDLPLHEVPPKSLAPDLDSLQVKEVVGEFTTRHPPNQPRVKNIHRIADMVRGTVIKPGETYSLNKAVGPRTEAKGFVVDHVIIDGKFEDSVGGGISQFATTTFNAAFFAGLDFGEYQAHTIYIDRYPYGREATISYPHPDLQIKNSTPYGVLLWPSYTADSITMKLFSTKYATGAQTNQSTQQVNNCTRVTTERTRTYVDGRTAVDSVRALYQPKEGEMCR